MADTLANTPDDESTHWTTRLMAARHGIGKDTVARIWRDHGLKPWKVEVFKLSNDPDFEEKLVDVVGLYLNPPERAVVFSFDEKTQCQALDRTQPSLPMKRGRGKTMTDDYKRNGTTDLFAALNIATGEVLYDTKPRHRAIEVLAFFKYIDLHVPADLEVHVVLDNLSTHKAPEITKWLAHPKRRRWHLHFTPTSSSWLNLIEGWFHLLTERRLRRGTFTNVNALIEAIELWAEHWNDDPNLHLAQDRRRDHHQSPPRSHHTHRSQISDTQLGSRRLGRVERDNAWPRLKRLLTLGQLCWMSCCIRRNYCLARVNQACASGHLGSSEECCHAESSMSLVTCLT